MKHFIYIVVACALLSSCSDNVPANGFEMQTGILRNYTGLDGCGWVIIDEDGQALEPINLQDFNVDLVEYKSITFTYTEINSMSICMVGPIIELVTVKID